ncbi:toprim domain-containing protein [Lentibacillus saliphilus]|uniref:toprim domain-containing protein n=1 Tax=Lentibacillus saliphilus TaxID=2737028 RepID=UPI001C2FF1D9|nr:toprim domain-containing protein [Lentibacillus saliphilus]
MMTNVPDKVMIVEGLTDKRQVEKVLTDDIEVICTNGTLGVERFDDLLERYDLDNKDVYILVDEDEPGFKLRRQLRHELPHAIHIHVASEFREVATTPYDVLATALVGKHLHVNPDFL